MYNLDLIIDTATINASKLHRELAAAINDFDSVVMTAGKLSIVFSEVLDDATLQIATDIINSHDILDLEYLKQVAFKQLDDAYLEKLEKGFLSGYGVTVALNLEAKANWANIIGAKQFLSYPMLIPSIDGTSAITIDSESDLSLLHASILAMGQSRLGAFTQSKGLVAAASDQGTLDAIVADYVGAE